jgi:NAD(P)-dependent dehydrogenase (short-subunit alcohol dehydrogenase family)
MGVKQILVAGGAGFVGEWIVRALLRDGHKVVVSSRSATKLEQLRSWLGPTEPGRLICFTGDVGEEAGATEIRDRFRAQVGRLDVAIASLGGWFEGRRLIDIDGATWDKLMNEFLRTHFIFARTFIPLLQAQGGGRYIGIGGGAAYYPVPLSAPVSVAAAGQLMLTRALRSELPDPEIDILELVADGPVRTRDSESYATADWLTADAVAAVVAELANDGRTSDPFTTANGPILRMRPGVRAG